MNILDLFFRRYGSCPLCGGKLGSPTFNTYSRSREESRPNLAYRCKTCQYEVIKYVILPEAREEGK